jgi:hypothetical protein
MNKCNFTCLFAGILIGVIVTATTCYFMKNSSDNGVELVVGTTDSAAAIQFQNRYKSQFPAEIEGINISKEQLDAINTTISETYNGNISNISGFRLYNGISGGTPSKRLSIVYPIDLNLRKITPSNLFYASGFNDRYSLPCPRFCD